MPTATRLRTVQSGAFTPAQLSGLHTWMDASRITGLTNGAAVATWSDLSGNAHHATQATAGKRPTYTTAVQNSLPAVLFDGSDDRIETATFTALTVSTIFAVVKAVTATGDRNIIDGQASARHLIGIRTNNWITYQGGGNVAGATATDTSAHVLVGLFRGTASSQIAVDGTLSATADIGSHSMDFLFLGASGGGAGTEFYNGYIAEVLIYNRILLDAERQTVEDYLGGRWNITIA